MIALLLGLCLVAGDLEQAERAYRLGEFAQAMQYYTAALPHQEGHRGAVMCNLGNCAFQLGRHAEAALWFRRALLRLPGDGGALHNLALCERALAIEGAAPGPGRGAGFVWLALAAGLQGIGLAGALLLRGRGARCAMAGLVLAGLAAAATAAVEQWWSRVPTAVALAPSVLHPAPGAEAAAGSTLRPGQLARVVARSGEWLRVETATGAGWVAAASVGPVD